MSASTVDVTKDDDAEEDPSGPATATAVEEPVLEEESGGDDSEVVDPDTTVTPGPQGDDGDLPAVAVVDTGSDYSAQANADKTARLPNSTPASETAETSSATRSTTQMVTKAATADPVTAVEPSEASTTSTTVMALSATTPEPAHEPAFLQGPITVRSIVTDVLTWFGLGPLAGQLPVTPAPLPPVLESLWLVVRRAGYTYLNQAPAAAPTISGQNLATGVTTGKLNATDYDDDHLTYTVTGAPSNGTVTVDSAGNFTYTPTAGFVTTGGQDQFTVTIDDRPGNPWHVHGLVDALGLVPGTTATVTVTVTANTPPKVTAPGTVGTADPETGVVSGSVHVSDAEGGLTFAVGSRPAPFYGTVIVDAETGDWTFTPTGAARRQAALSSWAPDKQVSFEVTATDGLHTVSTWIKAPITPPDNEVVDVITGTGGRSVGMAVSPDGSRAVIAHANGTVTIINTVTRSVIQTFTVGGLPTDVAISADGKFAYIPNHDKDTVDIVHLGTAEITDWNLFEPTSIVLSPDGKYAYVGHGDSTLIKRITVVRVDGAILEGTIELGGFGSVGDLAVSPDGKYLYYPSIGFSSLWVIDPATEIVVDSIELVGAHEVAVSPDGRLVYVTSGSNVSVVDATTNTVKHVITVDSSTSDVAVSPDGSRAYVVNFGNGTVSVIDTSTNVEIDTITVGALPSNVAFSPDGTRAYVANGDGSVSVISLVPVTTVDPI